MLLGRRPLSRRRCLPLLLTALLALSLGGATAARSAAPAGGGAPEAAPAAAARIRAAFGQLPLSFEPNAGQTDPQVAFLARGSGYTLFLTPAEAVLALRSPAPAAGAAGQRAGEAAAAEASEAEAEAAVVRLRLVEANPAPALVGEAGQPGKVNYLVGNDPAAWRTNIPTYGRVRYAAVYPGIDLVYHGDQGQLEYDFLVAPGADPGQIALAFAGAERVAVDGAGELVLGLGGASCGSARRACTRRRRRGGRRSPAGTSRGARTKWASGWGPTMRVGRW